MIDVMETRRFRMFFWQKLVPLVALPVFGVLFVASPVVEGWSARAWLIAGAIVGGAISVYLYIAWRQALVVLDGRGMTLWLSGSNQTWPYEKLLKIKIIGKYRVRMCFDPDIADKHMHISFDLLDPYPFHDEILDRYEAVVGAELPEIEEHRAAA